MYDLCVNEYWFLKYFKEKFANNLKLEVQESRHSRTILSFGNVKVCIHIYMITWCCDKS